MSFRDDTQKVLNPLNLGNLEEDRLRKILKDTNVKEEIRLILPKDMMLDSQKAFTTLDYKAKGLIGKRDVTVTLRALGIEPTSIKVKKLIERADTEKSGMLSRDDFESMMAKVINDIDSDDQMERAFHLFDPDNDGFISFNELKIITEKLMLDVADEEVKEMIQFANGGEEEKVSAENFVEAARKIY